MLKPGSFIADRYEILERVGSGGMSEVYKAKCHKLNRNVAIKILKEEFAEDKSFVTKFKTEAQAVAGLVHPNIVNVYDVGEDQGYYYIVMEYIEGITLKQYIEKKGQLAIKESVSIAIQVAQGIEAAHNNNIVHRDIKPQNILISREGKVKVTDFGIARVATTDTIDANTVGSVHYISPEQARGGFVDSRTDIYSLGITLYEMVTGRVPFDGNNNVSIALKHIQDEMVPANELVPSVPISVEKIIEKCTQKKPDNRYSKISALLADLKKSLIMPNEDFVMMAAETPTDETVMMSPEEAAELKNAKRRHYDDFDDDDDDYDDEDDDEDYDDFDDDYDDEDDERAGLGKVNKKMDKLVMIGGICAAAIVVIILIVIVVSNVNGGCAGSSKSGTETEDQSGMAEVPNVVGKNVEEDDVEGILTKAGFKVKFQYKESNTVEDGYVISQSEEAGSMVKKGTKITVVVSGGKEDVAVTDVVGQDKDKAVAALKEAGFDVEVKAEYNDSVEINKVISTDPAAGKTVAYGSTVTVTVSRGPENNSDAKVPNLLGSTDAQARAKLEAVGLVLGDVSYSETSNSADFGKVISQSYDANASLPAGTAVGITLGKEAETAAPTYKATVKFTISDPTGANSALELDGSTAVNVTISGSVSGGGTDSETVSIKTINEIPQSYKTITFTGLTSNVSSATVELTANGRSYAIPSTDITVDCAKE
ncbi:MAG: Stk1 family PASTA domain-containing Ser/Thr kinase [Lachnospiraceae bacterium]|nr:Stk1 family PASTA domain-containing Ser/Thr kinase [Lachnospiraceae bacterium]